MAPSLLPSRCRRWQRNGGVARRSYRGHHLPGLRRRLTKARLGWARLGSAPLPFPRLPAPSPAAAGRARLSAPLRAAGRGRAGSRGASPTRGGCRAAARGPQRRGGLQSRRPCPAWESPGPAAPAAAAGRGSPLGPPHGCPNRTAPGPGWAWLKVSSERRSAPTTGSAAEGRLVAASAGAEREDAGRGASRTCPSSRCPQHPAPEAWGRGCPSTATAEAPPGSGEAQTTVQAWTGTCRAGKRAAASLKVQRQSASSLGVPNTMMWKTMITRFIWFHYGRNLCLIPTALRDLRVFDVFIKGGVPGVTM